MALSLFSVPTPHQTQFYKHKNSWPTLTYPCSSSSKLIVPLCSPSPTAAVEDDPPHSPDELPAPLRSEPATKQSGCMACGREETETGCNGEGRIQGGIATVPGFGWWPIKAYRPCPGFVASGGRYRRQGQSMDDVVAGRGKTPSIGIGSQRKITKEEGLKKFKR